MPLYTVIVFTPRMNKARLNAEYQSIDHKAHLKNKTKFARNSLPILIKVPGQISSSNNSFLQWRDELGDPVPVHHIG